MADREPLATEQLERYAVEAEKMSREVNDQEKRDILGTYARGFNIMAKLAVGEKPPVLKMPDGKFLMGLEPGLDLKKYPGMVQDAAFESGDQGKMNILMTYARAFWVATGQTFPKLVMPSGLFLMRFESEIEPLSHGFTLPGDLPHGCNLPRRVV